jgi:hypothetical protein
MAYESRAAGLLTETFDRDLLLNEQINVIKSLTWSWRVLEILPFKRLTFERGGNGRERTRRLVSFVEIGDLSLT